jgi:putative addiction module component (TIGR02574 family)
MLLLRRRLTVEARTRQVLELALQLPLEEQEELLDELAGTLGTWDEDVTGAWAEEATRRWVRIATGQTQTVPWDEVRRGLTGRFGV